jgi:hypothetical protein
LVGGLPMPLVPNWQSQKDITPVIFTAENLLDCIIILYY